MLNKEMYLIVMLVLMSIALIGGADTIFTLFAVLAFIVSCVFVIFGLDEKELV